MLKQRVITALVLASLITWGVLQLSSLHLGLLLLPLILLGAWEWSAFIPLANNKARLFFLSLAACLLFYVWFFLDDYLVNTVLPTLVSAFWLCSIFWMRQIELGRKTSFLSRVVKGLLGLLILSCCWISILLIHTIPNHGPVLLLTLFVMIWATDTGAYFAGKRWGKHQLAPQVSPKKTWEGFWGGCLLGLVVAVIFALNMGWQGMQLILFAGLSLLVIIASVLGDLFESLLKRHQSIKDSGSIFPGHGGVLDRIDSVTAAAPIYLLGLYGLNLA